jgi:hypothetical protein
MEEIKEAIRVTSDFIKQHPDKKDDALGLLDLFESEVAEGGSPTHELSMLERDLKELVDEQD